MKKLVILDPGHGKRSGAICGDVIEDDLALEYAKITLNKARRCSDFNVALTRYGDIKLSIPARAEMANEQNADLLVSLHFNASEKTEARGTEALIYPGSKKGRAFALLLLANVEGLSSPLRIRGVKDGYFRLNPKNKILPILSKTEMPAVLWEIGFISNVKDCLVICSEYMKLALCDALLKAIETYFKHGGNI